MSEENELSNCTERELQDMYDRGEITAICFFNYTDKEPNYDVER